MHLGEDPANMDGTQYYAHPTQILSHTASGSALHGQTGVGMYSPYGGGINTDDMAGNNRRTQPLNTRVVYESIDITTLNDGASALLASASALIVATLLAF